MEQIDLTGSEPKPKQPKPKQPKPKQPKQPEVIDLLDSDNEKSEVVPTIRTRQQQPAAHQAGSTQSNAKHVAANPQQQQPPAAEADDVKPAVSGPAKGARHPPPHLQDLHAQRQAAKSHTTAGQAAHEVPHRVQQAAQPQSVSPMLQQLANQVIESRQATQSPASSQATPGRRSHHTVWTSGSNAYHVALAKQKTQCIVRWALTLSVGQSN